MSFFNLTQLGPSDPFSSAREKSSSSQPASDGADHMITQPKTINPPPSLSAPCPSFVREMYGEETDHKEITSHKEFTNRRIKHQRSDKGIAILPLAQCMHTLIHMMTICCIYIRSNGYI